MERNLILAIVFSVVIILGFQYFFQTFSPPPAKKPQEITEAAKQAKQPDEPTTVAQESVAPKAPAAAPSKPEAAPSVPAPSPAKEKLVTIETPKYEARVSSVGARIVSFKLKNYTVGLKDTEPVNLFEANGLDTSGPTIDFTRRDETFKDEKLGYECDAGAGKISLTEATSRKSITFRTTTAGGLVIAKTFTFHADSYAVDFKLTLTNESGEDRNYLITFPWRKVYTVDSSNRFVWNSAEILLDGVLKDYQVADIKGEEEPSGAVEWAGLGDVYFFKALVFGEKPATKVTLFKPTKEGLAEIWIRYGGIDLPKGQPVENDLMLYLGPKKVTSLEAAGHNLPRALQYSSYRVLDIMAEYLLKFLRFCNTGFEVFGIKVPGTGNWGIDIIILTVFIKILFIPLTHKSMKSMKRMQDLQPQMAKLKEKYKDDKAAQNKATMELFREHKVNPLGGCWPMFLQFPVFIALYQALSYAIELRHAPFVCLPSIYLCINDLSAPDPYYVTPVLMGGTMVLQQWMTPSAGDPMQKKMMLLMPVFFTYLFLSFPSGLVLYWLVSNVLSIGQQLITNRMAAH
ncbi:MAG: membrane protein insertase YidC [Desulfomonile tiedjei]|nr:membrane protein insertase YidC [Desulfomonile tiedjei]